MNTKNETRITKNSQPTTNSPDATPLGIARAQVLIQLTVAVDSLVTVCGYDLSQDEAFMASIDTTTREGRVLKELITVARNVNDNLSTEAIEILGW